MKDASMDADLDAFSRDQLVAEVKRLRAGIRAHRDSTGHELCWHHPDLWGLLPEKTDPQPAVPAWPQFMAGCIRYRQSLDRQLPDAPRTSQTFEGTTPENKQR
jgi:hypothetical protein